MARKMMRWPPGVKIYYACTQKMCLNSVFTDRGRLCDYLKKHPSITHVRDKRGHLHSARRFCRR